MLGRCAMAEQYSISRNHNMPLWPGHRRGRACRPDLSSPLVCSAAIPGGPPVTPGAAAAFGQNSAPGRMNCPVPGAALCLLSMYGEMGGAAYGGFPPYRLDGRAHSSVWWRQRRVIHHHPTHATGPSSPLGACCISAVTCRPCGAEPPRDVSSAGSDRSCRGDRKRRQQGPALLLRRDYALYRHRPRRARDVRRGIATQLRSEHPVHNP